MAKRVKDNTQEMPAASAQPELTQPDLTQPTIAEIFGPGGALEKCMPNGYEHRPSQLEMAELVEAAFREKRHVIVEAGTGTGKTLAYLIPAIRSGRRGLLFLLLAVAAIFRERYNQRWFIQRFGYLMPAQARQQLLALGAAA
jgi:hypothetical protein